MRNSEHWSSLCQEWERVLSVEYDAQAVGQAGVWGNQEPTGLPLLTLAWLGNAVCDLPTDFTPHQHTQKLLQRRRYATQAHHLLRV